MTSIRSLGSRSDRSARSDQSDTRTTRSFNRTPGFVTRDSGAPGTEYCIVGHAAVFNEPCDFRYFQEFIAPGAFKNALKVKPLEVVSNVQHDDRWILGHTLNGTLDLSEDDIGLRQWTRVASTSYAADLQVLIDRGDIQQASFCFTIKAEEWEYIDKGENSEEVKVTITEVGTLYDVTVCALGAYSQTDVAIEAASRSRLDAAIRSGRVQGLPAARARRLTADSAGASRRRRRAATIQRQQQLARARDLAQARAQVRAGRDVATFDSARSIAPVSASKRTPVTFDSSRPDVHF